MKVLLVDYLILKLILLTFDWMLHDQSSSGRDWMGLFYVKRGMVRCLYDRARNITQRDESLKEEEGHLMKTFIGNGYPRAFVCSAVAPRTPREPREPREPTDDDDNTEKPPPAFLPYVAGVSERIKKVCRDFNIRTVFERTWPWSWSLKNHLAFVRHRRTCASIETAGMSYLTVGSPRTRY